MPIQDELGKRMKEYYESIPKTKLMRRCPVAIRIDGKAFHTFTKKFRKPFDDVLIASMQKTMQYLCQNIQGCVFGYTQSDEITLILTDYKNLNTSAFFDYEVQKVCSITASMATLAFNRIFAQEVRQFKTEVFPYRHEEFKEDDTLYIQALEEACIKGAMFDSRCFNIPKEEVCNLIYWRQLDAMRNSVEMAGHAYFSVKELHKKTCRDIKTMLLESKEINWDLYPVCWQRGTACFKTYKERNGVFRSEWVIDKNMPVLKDEGRLYVEVFL